MPNFSDETDGHLLHLTDGGGVAGAVGAGRALYWYCADNHEGQNSELYSLLSQSKYKPAQMETGIDPEDYPDALILEALEEKQLDPQEVAYWIDAQLAKDGN